MATSSQFKSIKTMILALAAWTLFATTYGNAATENPPLHRDNRYDRLENFFQSFGCPAPHYVTDYLGAADSYAIDYRLLPAISVLESTCGLYQRLNNRWGWDSARQGFSSVRAGLQYIARQLSQGRYYKNKPLEEKVRLYNPNPQYARQVKKLMLKIDDRSAVIAQEGGSNRSTVSRESVTHSTP
ncbi:MAG: hypothetical protein M3O20_00615 [Acidobacteriota bacterium]|nr:hypothetical protein [Acidobacteriota bacterium]